MEEKTVVMNIPQPPQEETRCSEEQEGPDGLRDYRPHQAPDHHMVGAGDVSSEATLDSSYILRPAPGTPLERPRNLHPGEIGWGQPWLADWPFLHHGQQIVLGDFRQQAEDRTTHQYLGAWYPGPKECTPSGSDGYYRENIYSGRPGTANVRCVSASSPWRPSRSHHSHVDRWTSQEHAHSSSDNSSVDRE